MANSYNNTSDLTTLSIIVSIVSIIGGIACCCGLCIIVICIIKHFTKPNTTVSNGQVIYPHPPYPSNIPNYPMQRPTTSVEKDPPKYSELQQSGQIERPDSARKPEFIELNTL